MASPFLIATSTLDLSALPPIYLSTTHFEGSTASGEIQKLETELLTAKANLTYSPHEAAIVLSRAGKKARAKFDLRAIGLSTIDATQVQTISPLCPSRGTKRKRGDFKRKESLDSSTETEGEGERGSTELSTGCKQSPSDAGKSLETDEALGLHEGLVRVVNLEWFMDSIKSGEAHSFDKYVIYRGYKSVHSNTGTSARAVRTPPTTQQLTQPNTNQVFSILARAKEDQASYNHSPQKSDSGKHNRSQYAHLLRTTTTEHDTGLSSDLPPMPAWVQLGLKYACQRSTPRHSPNEPFISSLRTIKLARLLTGDEIGVRAYSTSISALAAYPYALTSPREILALPGCDAKIANLFVEWKNLEGRIEAVEQIESDAEIQTLNLFYEIWGVGAMTAREFYYDKGWRDLDDVVEHGWKSLSRVQQIGVKYYDEFLDRIPRKEVEAIAEIVHRHAVRIRDSSIQSMLVGGYRRGKETCGDVDIVISHPDESQTLNLIIDLVASLEQEGWITHTLLLSLHNTQRDQQTLPFRPSGKAGAGFDSLDKALVVWQDPEWPTREVDLAQEDPQRKKNPNIHRRVDIIIAPWRTVGCAVVGWTGGTTFERDLRRYAKNVKGWKFDSSGVRDRRNGEVLDLEGFLTSTSPAEGSSVCAGRAKTMEEAERRVFEGLGIEYQVPWERCTG